MTFSFDPCGETKDGKTIWRTVCPHGVSGKYQECSPTDAQIAEADRRNGRENGAKPRFLPDLVDGSGTVRATSWSRRVSSWFRREMSDVGGIRERRRG